MGVAPATKPVQEAEVPLEEFGGLVTELTPADIPEGASPFCQDVDFQLGAVFTRAGLTAQFTGQLGTVNVNYLKTFTLPNTNDQCLVLDSSGEFWFEDSTNNPGTLNAIGLIAKGAFANSATQFGREYLTFDDGFWGYDAPRQWDSTFFDRVSQDGPGAAPSVADENPAATALAASPSGLGCIAAREVRFAWMNDCRLWRKASSSRICRTVRPIQFT